MVFPIGLSSGHYTSTSTGCFPLASGAWVPVPPSTSLGMGASMLLTVSLFPPQSAMTAMGDSTLGQAVRWT